MIFKIETVKKKQHTKVTSTTMVNLYLNCGGKLHWFIFPWKSDQQYSYGEEDVDDWRPIGWSSLLCRV